MLRHFKWHTLKNKLKKEEERSMLAISQSELVGT